MEASGARFDAWLADQTTHTNAVLAAAPGRAKLQEHMAELSNQSTEVSVAVPVGRRLFFLRQDRHDQQRKLVMRDLDTRQDRILLDPNRMPSAGAGTSLDQFRPSQDGRYVAAGLSAAGSGEDILRIVDTETGRLLPEAIDRARFAKVSWLPDNASFFYTRLRVPGAHDTPAQRYLYQKVYLHRVGEAPSLDIPVFGASVAGVSDVAPGDFVSVEALTGTRFALGHAADFASGRGSLFIARLPANGGRDFSWTRLSGPDDGVAEATASRDTLFLRTQAGAPRYRILAVALDNPVLAKARVVVPEGTGVLTNMAAASDALFVAELDGVHSRLQRIPYDGQPAYLTLPADGTIDPITEQQGTLAADARVPGAVFGLDRWVAPTEWFAVAGGDQPQPAPLELVPAASGAERYVVTETSAPSKERGVSIPLSIIERSGTPHDARRAVLIEAYGAYGQADVPDPSMVPLIRGWVDAGGVFAVAHVRGGGEFGEAWHEAGQKAKKLNSARDLLDCAAALAKLGYATPASMAAMGTGAGGIAVGDAITLAPAAFRAAFIRSGAVNMVRAETAEFAPGNVHEFGSSADPADAAALLAMDVTQRVKPGAAYPAVMLSAGLRDRIVPVWESAKLAALLQATEATSNGPTLLRVAGAAGHADSGAAAQETAAELADGYAFLLWQLEAPRTAASL
jgi:prolyl oligopeptidase